MTKYHINTKGVPAICRANIKACPCGTIEEHFDTIEQAQEYADKINKGEAIRQKSTRLTKIADMKEVFEVGMIQHLNNLTAKVERLETNFKNKYKKKSKKEREKLFSQYKQTDLRYQGLRAELNDFYKKAQQTIQERLQANEMIKSTKSLLIDFSFSKASSSAYMVYRKQHLDNVVKQLESEGYVVRVNPATVRKNSDEEVLVRIANHLPKEFYKSGETNDLNVWKHTDVDVLVEYKTTDVSKKMSEKDWNQHLSQMLTISNNLKKLRSLILFQH